jgi:hypothetical protein
MDADMKEIWEDINGFEGIYQVSNKARVKSLHRVITRANGHKQTIKERIIKTCFNTSGYEDAVVQNGEKSKHLRVHRLVAIAFVPNPDNKKFVNHKDGKKANNLPDNLEWCTRSENEKHAHRIGLKDWSGEGASKSKLTESQVKEIRALRFKMTGRDVGVKYGVGHCCIFRIWHRKTWKHV